MLARLWLRLVMLGAAMLMLAAPATAQSAVPSMPARVVAIGDLHGDHAAWIAIARDAGLIDGRGKWAGGKTVLVQTGDVADRGPDTLKIIRDLVRLRAEAEKAGGRIVTLVGNHEAMNMTGDLRYVSPGEYAAFADANSEHWREFAFKANRKIIEGNYRAEKPTISDREIRLAWLAATPLGKVEHQAAWSAKGEIGKWVIANPAMLRLGDTLFVHAGLSASYAARSIDDINTAVAKALMEREVSETAIVNDPAGPLWYRGLAGVRAEASQSDDAIVQTGSAAAAELTQVLEAQGAQRMVVGHTPVLSGVSLRHDGRLAMIDTGISASYGGKLGYLEIVDGKWVPRLVPRPASGSGDRK